MRYEKAAIHKVFRLFHNFSWAEIFCPNPQKRVFRGCLQFAAVMLRNATGFKILLTSSGKITHFGISLGLFLWGREKFQKWVVSSGKMM